MTWLYIFFVTRTLVVLQMSETPTPNGRMSRPQKTDLAANEFYLFAFFPLPKRMEATIAVKNIKLFAKALQALSKIAQVQFVFDNIPRPANVFNKVINFLGVDN